MKIKKITKPMQIPSSARLTYRLFDISNQTTRAKDVEEIWQMEQDPEVMQFITNGVITTREALHNTFIPRIQSYTQIEQGFGMWRVALKQDDTFIGEITARPLHFNTDTPNYENIELGWRFAKPYWGYGFATEASLHVMAQLKLNHKVTHFCAMADAKNTASIKIMHKLGMHYVKNVTYLGPTGEATARLYQRSA